MSYHGEHINWICKQYVRYSIGKNSIRINLVDHYHMIWSISLLSALRLYHHHIYWICGSLMWKFIRLLDALWRPLFLATKSSRSQLRTSSKLDSGGSSFTQKAYVISTKNMPFVLNPTWNFSKYRSGPTCTNEGLRSRLCFKMAKKS